MTPDRPIRTGLKRRRIAGLLLIGILIGLGAVAYEVQALIRRQLPQYLRARVGQALGREVTIGRVSFWPLGAVTVHDFRVLPLPGEPGPPLTAARVRARVSLWDLLLRRRLRVTALDVYGARAQTLLDLRKPAEVKANPADQLLALHRIGLERIGIHNAGLEFITVGPDGVRQSLNAEGVSILLDLRADAFTYRLSASRWSVGGLSGQALLFKGAGDSEKVTVTDSRVVFDEGGALQADGAYVSGGNDLVVRVRAQDLPVGRLAPQLGIPSEWDVRGTLNGALEVSATSGSLRRIQGSLTVAPGAVAREKTEFPWNTASVGVDWRPDGITLRDLSIQGAGFRLHGSAEVTGGEGVSLPRRPFTAKGTLDATSTDAVASLAQLLAFQTPVRGQWEIGQLNLTFQASGRVGDLRQARADGHFEAAEMKILPRPSEAPLVLRTVKGRIERGPAHLRLRQVRAEAEGLTAEGDVSITPGTEARPGAFRAKGEVDLKNLISLREQLPNAPFWEWISPAKPESRGRATFQASGPLGDVSKLAADVGFRFRNFEARLPAGPDGERWTLPVRDLTGRASARSGRLELSGLKLRSDLLTGAGQGMIQDLRNLGHLSGEMRFSSSRWTELTPLKGRLPNGLTGGSLAVRLRMSNSTEDGITGSAFLERAAYHFARGSSRRSLAVQAALADFRIAERVLVIPQYKLVTPRFRTSGQGTVREAPEPGGGARWLLKGDGRLHSDHAGTLLQMAGSDVISGGRLMATYTIEAAAGAAGQVLKDTVASARVRLEQAQPRFPSGSLPLSPDEARIRVLTGKLALDGGVARLSNAIWQAPRFRVSGEGGYDGRDVQGTFRLVTRAWYPLAGELARTLPIAGGTLTATVSLSGPVERLASLPVRGSARLSGARLAGDRNASVPLDGGRVAVRVDLAGTLGELVGAQIDGTFMIEDVPLPIVQPGAKPLLLKLAHGRFRRRGAEVSLFDLAARVPGAGLTGGGTLKGIGTGSASHRFDFRASGRSLSSLLPMLAPVPGKVSGGDFKGSLTLAGTAIDPLARLTGNAEVTGAKWTPPGIATALEIHRLKARFVRRGSVAEVDQAEFQTAGGSASLTATLRGLGTPAGARHTMRVNWRFENASAWATRFLPVPGWFSGGLFSGAARIQGTAREPAAIVHGRLAVRNAGFKPPAQILGGPAKAIPIRRAAGTFYRSGSVTVLNSLELESPYATARGSVSSHDNGDSRLKGRVEIAKLEALVDLWPDFQDRIRHGRGAIHLDLRGPLMRPRELVGTVNLFGQDGALTVAEVEELYALQPFDEFLTRLVLRGDRVRLKQVKIRGPKFNLDGRGVVTADGKIRADGKAWFTTAYTKQVVGSKLIYSVAKLVGWGRVNSDLRMFGTLRDPRLKLGITNSLVWKLFIRRKVPERLRKIATGDAPVWPVDSPSPGGSTRR